MLNQFEEDQIFRLFDLNNTIFIKFNQQYAVKRCYLAHGLANFKTEKRAFQINKKRDLKL
jgi:hypothetical protein